MGCCARFARGMFNRAGYYHLDRPAMLHRYFFLSAIMLALVGASSSRLSAADKPAAQPGWKAGVAKAVITPEAGMWMAGYGSRDKPAEGKLHDLWVKALALEDANGRRAVIVSTDTLGIPRIIYNRTLSALKQRLQLEPAQIMLNSSHTHCGPVLRGALKVAYPLDEEQIEKIDAYGDFFETQLVSVVEEAFAKLEPAILSTGRGTAGFAVNRRNNKEPDVPHLIRAGSLKGPVDHDVPVLAVRAADGSLKAVVFGYACHNTVLSFYQWCGDYAGFAQYALEESHPGAVALFAMGCGGDQNPLPRRNVYDCRRYGGMLAAAVEEVLRTRLRDLEPELMTGHRLISLTLDKSPSREQLEKDLHGGDVYRRRWAKMLLAQLDEGKSLAATYEYPIQAWKLGSSLLWITLGGEVTVEYSLAFKKELGRETWVTGYCNDVMAYIPSSNVLAEGGYEGASSMIVYGMPAERWADDTEQRIFTGVKRLADELER